MSALSSDNRVEKSPSSCLLARVGEFVECRMGLHFPQAQQSDLERGIRSASREFGFDDVVSCMEWLLSSPLSHSQIETLAGHLTIGETYFFRDKKIFETLETHILPEIIRSRQERKGLLRIWSAGCSTGEEPYSLAILIRNNFRDLLQWDISILATDIAPLSLEKASKGRYGEWSFRDTPLWVREGYFQKMNRKYQIDPQIRKMVTFSNLNLVEDLYPAIITNTNAMDIIFCRNVLMYFSRERAQQVIRNLAGCLVDNGWLVISPIEAPDIDLSPLLHPVRFPDATLYQKGPKPKEMPAPYPARRAFLPETDPKCGFKSGARTAVRTGQLNDSPIVSEHPLQDVGQESVQVRRLANQGKLHEALALCEQAIHSDKLNPTLHYLQATIFQELGRLDEATATLKRAIYIDQDFVIAHFALGHLMHGRRKYREADKHLEKACALLKTCDQEKIVPESEGINAGRLLELIGKMRQVARQR